MSSSTSPSLYVLRHPLGFVLQVLRDFRANQGLLLAGAVAYYTLLSIIPLFTLAVVGISHLYGDEAWLGLLRGVLDLTLPGLTDSLLAQVREFLTHRRVVGWVGLGLMLFFSSLAFTVLENTLSVIFYHRVAVRRRHFVVSAVIPYVFVLLLGLGLLVMTVIAGAIQHLGDNVVLALLLTAIYMVMPNGGLSVRHALLGGVAAALLWEGARHVLIWYFATLSIVNVVYGSLATAIVALLSLEVGGMILLLGAQVIATYERLAGRYPPGADGGFHTDT